MTCRRSITTSRSRNPNVSRYISTAEAEAEIDLAATHAERAKIDRYIRSVIAKHNEFLKELGLPLLPYTSPMLLRGCISQQTDRILLDFVLGFCKV